MAGASKGKQDWRSRGHRHRPHELLKWGSVRYRRGNGQNCWQMTKRRVARAKAV